MGLTYVEMEIAHPGSLDRWTKVRCLVDSGAVYSVVPSDLLAELGITPVGEKEFWLADGSKIVRKKGGAAYRYQGEIGFADVIFGEEGDANLLGAFTLEALGLSLDFLKRELRPLPMILGGQEGPRS